MAGHAQAAKLASPPACRALRASTCSATRQGAALRVEPAADVRRAVRALFAADPGPGVRHLLRTVHAVDHVPCASPAEAETHAAELAATLLPPRRRGRRRHAEAGLRCAVVLTAFVLIHAAPDRIVDLGPEIADVDGVAEVYSVTGDLDLVAIVRVREHERLADVVTRHISSLDGVVHTTTMIAFQAYSRHDLDSMWNLGIE